MPAPSARRSRSSGQGGVDYSDIRRLARDFGGLPPALRRRIRPTLLAVGRRIAATAKTNASWSSRIPGSITVRANTSMKSGGVYVVARQARAPHARAYEGIATRAQKFRHPVFARGGNPSDWTWVDQATRPFIAPAIKTEGPDGRKELTEVVKAAMNRVGA